LWRWSPPPPAPPEEKPALDIATPNETGVASWYGDEWQGRITASGKPFDDRKLTAAHRTLALNTRVRVINLKTGRSVDVTIIDRGPYADGRVIDLSKAAAKKLDMVKEGLVPVRIESLAG
jgi:rare lipoprotein A